MLSMSAGDIKGYWAYGIWAIETLALAFSFNISVDGLPTVIESEFYGLRGRQTSRLDSPSAASKTVKIVQIANNSQASDLFRMTTMALPGS